ncbi:unnamed protein product [Clonostachys rosea f. rosea IK726]|uniref:Uncharacterized protein n=1 Tax=Clonostachys rosea f. rosea IK726 TaxID=1349383 RepID=A0ACA9U4L9_BIOOC|nr:unnamed protein product [Clonostachys rosea f. rosea IK726]
MRGGKWIIAAVLFVSRVSALQYIGADISSVIQEERAGIVYKNQNGTIKPLEHILAENGFNMVRQRVWVTDGDHGIDYNLQLAQRVVNAGMKASPPGWPTTDIDGLEQTIYKYTLDSLNRFAAAGLKPETVALGNEVNSGILVPVGGYDKPQNLSRLLKSASAAVMASNLSPKPKRLLHLTLCCEPSIAEWWYDLVLANGLSLDDFDVHAHSMYPYWGENASFSNFLDLSARLKSKYGNKEVQVVETGWPLACPNSEYKFPPDQTEIPWSSEGQEIYFQRMAKTLTAAGATGFNVREPAWVRNYRLGSTCAYAIMFDQQGAALDSFSVFKSLAGNAA